MNAVGLTAAIIGGISAITWVLTHLFDQVSVICTKAGQAFRSVVELRDEVRSVRQSRSRDE